MKKPKFFFSKILLTILLSFFFILPTNHILGQEKKSNQNQWNGVGGQIVASGSHDFTNFWYLGANGMWYKNDEDRKNPATHTSEEVTQDVVVKKGQIAVRGPGFLANFVRRVKATTVSAGLKFSETGNDFWTATLGGQDYLKGSNGWRWYDDNITDFDPTVNNGGWVPDGKTITLDIYAVSSQSGIGYSQYGAPKSVEYEFWFFPREGGKVITKADIKNLNNVKYDNPGHFAGKVTSGKVFDETLNKWLNPGDNIRTDHYYTTKSNETANMTLSSELGGAQISMKKNTKIKIVDKVAKKKSGGVFVAFGRLWSHFAKKNKTGFAVETYNSALGVEGTEFETSYNPETGETNVSVFEGTVSFECKTGTTPPIYLKAGMSATMDKYCNISSQNSTNNITNTGNTIYPIADNHVYAYSYSNWNKANWGKYEHLGVGWNPTGGEKRAYLKFDLSGIDANNFEKATLRLYHNHTGGGNAVELGVYAVEGSWTEGRGTYKPASAALPGELTWNNQPKIARYPTVYFNPGQEIQKWVEVDVTTLVKAWLNGFPNHGMLIKARENYIGKSEGQYGFYSREYEDADKRPQLVINGSSGNLQVSLGNLSVNPQSITEIPSVTGEWEITCNDGNIYKYNLKLVQYDNGFYGDMIRTNGSEANSKVEGQILSNGKIEFTRSKGNWKQYYIGEINQGSGSKANFMDGLCGDKGQERYVWYAKLLGTSNQSGSTNNALGTARLLTVNSNQNMVGPNETLRGNGKTDAIFRTQFSAPNRTVTAVEVSNTNGLRSVWDTRPNNNLWLGGVVIQNRTMSQSDGSVYFSLGSDQNTLDFFVEDNGSIRGGKTNYRMTIFFASGEPLKMDIVPTNSSNTTVAGQWSVNQYNGYKGIFNLQQSQSGQLTGNAIWDRHASGLISGQISGNLIDITISYPNGIKGFYKGTLTQNGLTIVNGSVTASDGRTNSTWDASKVVAVSSIAGEWLIDQSNGYNGSMTLQQDNSGRITGNAIWNGYLKGTIDGNVSGNYIEFNIKYPNGDVGVYKATLTQNGTKMINGTVKGNNGVTATWDASK